MRVLIGGSHGVIGTRLLERLTEEGHVAVRLARVAESEKDVRWDPNRGPIDIREMENFDAVIHLGGVSIGEKRWTSFEKQRLWSSRIDSTNTLVNSFRQLINPPSIFICASAVGYYGDQGDTELTESSPAGQGFLAGLCEEWEKSASVAMELDMRVAMLRSGVVFDANGGLLKRQTPLFKLCLGGRLGSGNQWMSWIDVDDHVSAILHILTTQTISGPINVTSPEPVTNDEFTRLLAAVLRRPAFVPAPRWMISLALGAQFTDEMLLSSARAIPQKLIDSGFEFNYADPAMSLVRLLSPKDINMFESEQDFELGPRRSLTRGEIDLSQQIDLNQDADGNGNGNASHDGS